MKSGVDRIGNDVSVASAKRSCFDKVRFRSKTVARDAAANNRTKHPDSLPQRAYRCSLCHGFHLTSQVPNGLKYRPKEARRA